MTTKEIAIAAAMEIKSAIEGVNKRDPAVMVKWPLTLEIYHPPGNLSSFYFYQLVREGELRQGSK